MLDAFSAAAATVVLDVASVNPSSCDPLLLDDLRFFLLSMARDFVEVLASLSSTGA